MSVLGLVLIFFLLRVSAQAFTECVDRSNDTLSSFYCDPASIGVIIGNKEFFLNSTSIKCSGIQRKNGSIEIEVKKGDSIDGNIKCVCRDKKLVPAVPELDNLVSCSEENQKIFFSHQEWEIAEDYIYITWFTKIANPRNINYYLVENLITSTSTDIPYGTNESAWIHLNPSLIFNLRAQCNDSSCEATSSCININDIACSNELHEYHKLHNVTYLYLKEEDSKLH